MGTKSIRRIFVAIVAVLVLVGGVLLAMRSQFGDRRVDELIRAAEQGDVARIDELVREGVDVNARDRAKNTPLLVSFLRKGYDFDLKKLRPSEQSACFEGFKALLRNGADPNALNNRGEAVMLLAAQLSDSKWLREALAHGGNPNLVNTGNPFSPGSTPIFYAINGYINSENLQLLITAGADVNHRDGHGITPLMGHLYGFEYATVLVESGADFRAKNRHGRDSIDELVATVNVCGKKRYLELLRGNERVWFLKLCDLLIAKGAILDFRE